MKTTVARRYIPALRWWIAGALFLSTTINYIDRQTLSLLAPYLKGEYHWSNSDYANIVIAFRVAYSIGQTVLGRLVDRIGTRQGLSLSVIWYSIASMATSLANGLFGFATLRFLLGVGESANWPAATKAVSEWFPKRERALATGFFDSGSSLGGAIAPFIVLPIYFRWGWRPAVMIPGVLGLIWLLMWRWLYYSPSHHPYLSPAEHQLIASDSIDSRCQHKMETKLVWSRLLTLPQTWGSVAARTFTDPVWFFVTDWFPIYLVAKGIELRGGLVAVWIPFLAADLGNLFAGWTSGYLISRGWPLGAARKALVIFGAIGMTLLVPTVFTSDLYIIAALFAISTFAYASFSTMALVLPTDLYPSNAVASVTGLGGTGSAIGTIIAFKSIGYLADARHQATTHVFDPIVIVAGLLPLVGMTLVLLLVRNTEATADRLVLRM